MAVLTAQHGKGRRLKYGLEVTVPFDNVDAFVGEAGLSQLGLYQQVFDFQVDLCVTT